ncbi:hypothetical protein DDQ50_00955 [Amnibacterium flavum]|uniref:Uncharacterized protein n=1 Tax=Amnibacterium flavum TaxID=2173173 RepID=A0A2V1HTX0_9MICO|nr:hypothetical protein DDQ50_00955 [Amnibacterium flavum]
MDKAVATIGGARREILGDVRDPLVVDLGDRPAQRLVVVESSHEVEPELVVQPRVVVVGEPGHHGREEAIARVLDGTDRGGVRERP